MPFGLVCRLHSAEYKAFLGDDWKQYLKEMEKQGTWGDELTLVRCGSGLQLFGTDHCSDHAFAPTRLHLQQPDRLSQPL